MRRPPIVVELHGRLGNQLFQFAAGYALARAHGAKLLFDDAKEHPGDLLLPELIGDQFRRADDDLLLRLGHRDPRRERRGRRYLRSWSAQQRARYTRRPVQVRERSPYRFDPDVVTATPPYFLRGFFQTERYFAAHAAEIAAAIRLPASPGPPDPGPTVAVSFRRGDYVGQAVLLPVRYQEAALERLCADVRPGSLVVFADDPDFAELVAPRLERFGPTRVGVARDTVGALAEMAACDHFVIPNSTFGWWAAWLGERRPEPRRHLVFAPVGWFDPARPDDVVPDRWERVAWE